MFRCHRMLHFGQITFFETPTFFCMVLRFYLIDSPCSNQKESIGDHILIIGIVIIMGIFFRSLL